MHNFSKNQRCGFVGYKAKKPIKKKKEIQDGAFPNPVSVPTLQNSNTL